MFDFLNGFHDSANSIATVVTTRVLKPQQAVLMAAFANFIAAFVITTSVAATIGKGIIDPTTISSATILAGLIAASSWNIVTWYIGLPISSSHALIGGLIGATIVKAGFAALVTSEILRIFLFIFLAPLIGMVGAMVFTFVTTLIVRTFSKKKLDNVFSKLQIASSFAYSVSHGANDAQKTMGVIMLTLITNELLPKTAMVPVWVILSCHAAITLGTLFGGWRIVKTLGTKIMHLKPFEGFCAETSSAITIFVSSLLGIPVSTTHVITGSIVGVGAMQNYRKVRWINTRSILLAWVVTIPVSVLLGAVMCLAVTVLGVR